jgi:hypothetical protein
LFQFARLEVPYASRLERYFTPDARCAQGRWSTPLVDAYGWPIGSRTRANCYRSPAAKSRRIWWARNRRPHHPSFPTRRRERASRIARPSSSHACAHADRADRDLPAEPYHPVRFPNPQPPRRRPRSARVYTHRPRWTLRTGRAAQYVVRERGDVPGLLADADQRTRAMHVVTCGTALATSRRSQG